MHLLSFSFDNLSDAIYNFFHPDLGGYANFDISESTARMLPFIVFAVFLGVFLASFYTLYIRSILGEMVRTLAARKIFSPDDAVTLAELGFSKNIFIVGALKNPYSLRRVVRSTEFDKHMETGDILKFRYAPKTEHFYLPEADKYKAEMRFGKSKTEFSTIFFVLLCLVICEIVVFACLPELISFFDNVISMFSIKGNTLQ